MEALRGSLSEDPALASLQGASDAGGPSGLEEARTRFGLPASRQRAQSASPTQRGDLHGPVCQWLRFCTAIVLL